MRTIRNRKLHSPPTDLKNSRDEQSQIAGESDRRKRKIRENIYKGGLITINDPNDPYHGQEEHSIKYKLRVIFHNKCAYCERQEYKPDVEHYRPKKSVDPPQENNHGYYWLCYEWSNLLPSCSQCNRRPGKHNKFPVLNSRVTTPPLRTNGILFYSRCVANHSFLLTENPGLLHPEIDQPENFLQMHSDWDGRLAPSDAPNGRGFHTISTCDLNRGNLKIARRKIIEDVINDLRKYFFLFRRSYITKENLKQALIIELTDIKEQSNIEKPYSFVTFFIWNNFQNFVRQNFPELDPIEAQLLIECHREIG